VVLFIIQHNRLLLEPKATTRTTAIRGLSYPHGLMIAIVRSKAGEGKKYGRVSVKQGSMVHKKSILGDVQLDDHVS
jgi:hypothetical protein